ncbi:MAG: VOC family protein [Acidimicrobiia bacterium]
MRIDRIHHATLLVNDLVAAEIFYDTVFSPHCFMRGYAPMPLHRDAALLCVGENVIEPMQPLPPNDGMPATTIFRYLDRFGEGMHSLAFIITGWKDVAAKLEAHGMRWTDGGMADHVFPHPKDFPGLLELADFGGPTPLPDPRLVPGFDGSFWRNIHPLGIDRTSHFTLAVRDRHRAAELYRDILDATILPEQAGAEPGAVSSYVMMHEGSIIEFAEPLNASSPIAADLERIGECWRGLTFKVLDLDRVAAHLERCSVRIASRDDETIRLDRGQTFGVDHAFTTRSFVLS